MPWARFMGVYVKHLPRLQAEEALRAIQVNAVPWMDKDDGRKVTRNLERIARGHSVSSRTPRVADSKERKALKLLTLRQQFGADVVEQA